MKKRIAFYITLLIIMITTLATPVLASYYANISVTETAGNTYGNLPLSVSVDNTNLASNYYIRNDGLDTRVTMASGTELPWMVVDDKVMTVVPAVPPYSLGNYHYTTGNATIKNMDIITGQDGYITTADAEALEPGDNFSIETSGYVDTTALGEDIFNKSGAVSLSVSPTTSGTITAKINPGAGNVVKYNYLYPSADVLTEIAQVFPSGSHYSTIDDPYNSLDITDFVYTGNTTFEKDRYGLTSTILDSHDIISEVRVYFYAVVSGGSGGYGYFIPHLYLNSTEQAGTQENVACGYQAALNQVISKPGGGDWTVDDLNNLNVGMSIKCSTSGYFTELCQLYIKITYTDVSVSEDSISITGASSGDHTYTTGYDGTYLYLQMDGDSSWDGVKSKRIISYAVPSNNSNNWIWGSNATPYFNYIKEVVNGTEVLKYQPNNIISGTILPDRDTGDGTQNGTITWGTNPEGLTITLGNMVSNAQPAPAVGFREGSADVAGESGQPGWSEEIGELTTNPFYHLVKPISETTGMPITVLWTGGAVLIIFAVMAICFSYMPHQLLTVIVGGVLDGAFIAMKILPFWTIFVFALMGVAVVLYERVQSV